MEYNSKTDKLQVSPFPFDIGQSEQSVHTKFSPSSVEENISHGQRRPATNESPHLSQV